MKKYIRSILQSIKPIIPFSMSVALARQDARFRFLVPLGRKVIHKSYLGSVKVNIDTTYRIEREMLLGEFDPLTVQVISAFLAKDSVAIDIGANIGAFTLLMAKLVSQGKVIAIEPGPPSVKRLQANLQLNPALQKLVSVHPVGLSDMPGELRWKEDKNNRGNADLMGDEGIAVQVTTLDLLLSTVDVRKIDFIKIDVEGMECEAIRGGLSTIRKHRPVIYYETLECFRELRGHDIFNDIFDMLSVIGYQIFAVTGDGDLKKLANHDCLQSVDTLAIHQDASFIPTSVFPIANNVIKIA